jgi:transposase InsO family protein
LRQLEEKNRRLKGIVADPALDIRALRDVLAKYGYGLRVKRVLERVSEGRGLPAIIQIDNGPEFTGRVLDKRAFELGVKLQFIEPGKPIQHAFIESFNSRLCEECTQRAHSRLA